MRNLLALFLAVGLGAFGCGRRGGGHGGPDDDDDDASGGGDDGADPADPYWCCDPDEPHCDCPGFWHCTDLPEGGKHCEQNNPPTPDDGSGGAWDCSYQEGMIICRGPADQHPDAGADGGWNCQNQGEMIECSRSSSSDDFPDQGGDEPWDCRFDGGGEFRECNQGGAPDDHGDCQQIEDCSDLDDNDCDGLVDCVDPDCHCGNPDGGGNEEVCDGRDNDQDGRIDEGRACGQGDDGDGPCLVGSVRICDAYCGVHQTCQADGSWGACTVDGSCAPAPECDQHSDCPRGYYCDFGSCSMGTFSFWPCESDQDCDDGFGFGGSCQVEQGVCITDCFHHGDCGPGLVCDLGMCVEDPYVPGQC